MRSLLSRPTWRGALLLAVTLGLLSGLAPSFAARPQSSAAPHDRLSRIRLTDGAGQARSLAVYRSPVLVLAFVGTTCPLSNRQAPLLSRLSRQYQSRGVQFVGINSVGGETAEAVGRHARQYGFPFPVLKDGDQHLAQGVTARVTPEVFVLDTRRSVRYRGCIASADAPAPGSPCELSQALDDVLAGRTVRKPETPAIGCTLEKAAPAIHAQPSAVTYHQDVAPVLERSCQSCHRPGQVAPFSLLTFADARAHAQDIRRLTATRAMPPWLAEPGHGDFLGSRRLEAGEVETLARWVESGMAEGDRAGASAPRTWPDGWPLGEPDVVLTVPEAHTLSAEGEDEFRVFLLPLKLPEDRQVVAIDFRPGNPRVVHHVVSLLDTTGKARALDAADPGPGYNSGAGGVLVPEAQLQGLWTPGNSARLLPPGIGRTFPSDADLLLQVHYHKTGKVERDQTRVGLYFAKEPVTRTAHTFILGSEEADIPAGAARHEVQFRHRLPASVRLLTVMPHMHLIGREMRVTATLPDGTQQSLVWVRNWDYRWQEAYRFKEPPFLPRGTEIEITAVFDNSAANPRNPSRPPTSVKFGEGTRDEMASVILEAVLEPRYPAR